MKLKTMLYGLTLMLGCFVLASCVNDEEGPCLPDGKTQVVFSLVLPDNAQTRAWEEGVGVDNNIDLSSIKLLIYEGSGACKGVLTSDDLNYIPRETGSTPYEKTVYDCIGTLPTTIKDNLVAGTQYRFVILANCNAIIDNDITWSDLSAVKFDRSQESMPMWGVQSGTLSLKAGETMSLGTITLLRAKAKVTVKLGADSTDGGASDETTTDDPLDGFGYISSIEVKNYSDKGFIVPEVAETVTATPENLAVSRTGYTVGTTPFIVDGSSTTKELTFYLLEYKNSTAAEADQAQLIVTLGKTVEGKEETKSFDFAPIKFRTYQNGAPSGDPFDIVRNYHYQFDITKVVDKGLYVEPKVMPWDFGYEFAYKTDVSASYSTGQPYLRWDTDGNLTTWQNSYVAVTHEWDDQSQVPGRTPLIILRTTSSEPMYLQLDNEHFEFVVQKTDGFEELGVDVRLEIPSGVNILTSFFVRPTSAYDTAITPLPSREAHMSLVSDGPVPAKVPLRGSMPGFAEDVDEIWFYWVNPSDYKVWPNGTGPDNASSEYVTND